MLFACVRVATACLPLLPDGDVMATATAIIFLLTGFVYSFSEIGALTWVLLTAPDGKRTTAVATLTSARVIGALIGVSCAPLRTL